MAASIKITLTPADFADLRASAERAGIPFSVFARLCYRSGFAANHAHIVGLNFGVMPKNEPVKYKVKAGITLKIPANKRKTKGKK